MFVIPEMIRVKPAKCNKIKIDDSEKSKLEKKYIVQINENKRNEFESFQYFFKITNIGIVKYAVT